MTENERDCADSCVSYLSKYINMVTREDGFTPRELREKTD